MVAVRVTVPVGARGVGSNVPLARKISCIVCPGTDELVPLTNVIVDDVGTIRTSSPSTEGRKRRSGFSRRVAPEPVSQAGSAKRRPNRERDGVRDE